MSYTPAKTKGSVLAYSLILLTIVLIASIGMMSSSIVNFRSVSTSDKSGNAFQVADSGAQAVIAKIKADPSGEIRDLGSCSNSGGSALITETNFLGGEYRLSFYGGGGSEALNCNRPIADITSVKSVGTYSDTTRAVQVAVAPTLTPIGWWKLNGSVNDETIYGNDGIRSSVPPESPPGYWSDALNLSGSTSGFVEIPNESHFDLRKAVSVSGWFYFHNLPDDGTWRPIVSKMNDNGLEDAFSVWVNASGRYVRLASSDAVGQETVDTPNDSVLHHGTWNHVVGVIDRDSGTMTAYINGGAPISRSIRTSDIIENDYPVRLGGNFERIPPPDTYVNLDGKIDDVRIYDGILSASDVARLYTSGRQ